MAYLENKYALIIVDKIELMIRVQNMLESYNRQHKLIYKREGEIVYQKRLNIVSLKQASYSTCSLVF